MIKPVLEERIEQSVVAGLTGELKIDFYRGGMRLHLKKARSPPSNRGAHRPSAHHADVACTALIFLQLLFGYRSLAELREIFPDVWAKDSAAVHSWLCSPQTAVEGRFAGVETNLPGFWQPGMSILR
ncbi:MAG: hypothetical protein R2873_19555 [Caldilineaceae bacterium]